MLCIIRGGDGEAFRERYTYAAGYASLGQPVPVPERMAGTSVEILVAEPKEDALGKAALSARLGVCLLIPYRDAPDKCSQNNTQQSQGGLLPKVRHH